MDYNKINYLIRFMPDEIIEFCEEVRCSKNNKQNKMKINLSRLTAPLKTVKDYVELFDCRIEESDSEKYYIIRYKGNK